MTEQYNSYMIAGFITIKGQKPSGYMVVRDGQTYEERRITPFYLRSDAFGGPQTAAQAAQQGIQLLSLMWTEGSQVASISVSAGSLDQPGDTHSLRKDFSN